jgi:hypothetical protein
VFPRLDIKQARQSHWYTVRVAAERYALRVSPRRRPLLWRASRAVRPCPRRMRRRLIGYGAR